MARGRRWPQETPRWLTRVIDAVFHLPIAVPSVAIGLGLLIAFRAVSAALDRLDPAYRQAAESLGAGKVRVLSRITLPLLVPTLGAAAG